MPTKLKILADIPKLGSQWKIIHEFKPTDYLQEVVPPAMALSLTVKAGNPPHSSVFIGFEFPNISLCHFTLEGGNPTHSTPTMTSSQLPRVGEWTKVEISHEEVDGEFFLSLAVGGREVGREAAGPDLRKLTDVKVCIGCSLASDVRRLVILEKR